jgi:hypothetical protein
MSSCCTAEIQQRDRHIAQLVLAPEGQSPPSRVSPAQPDGLVRAGLMEAAGIAHTVASELGGQQDGSQRPCGLHVVGSSFVR